MTTILEFPDDTPISLDRNDIPRVIPHHCPAAQKAKKKKGGKAKNGKTTMVPCPLCGDNDTPGTIREGHVTCPDCHGSGMMSKAKAAKTSTVQLRKFAVVNRKLPPPPLVTYSYSQPGWVLPAAAAVTPFDYPRIPWDDSASADEIQKSEPIGRIRGEDIFGDMRYCSDPAARDNAQNELFKAGAW